MNVQNTEITATKYLENKLFIIYLLIILYYYKYNFSVLSSNGSRSSFPYVLSLNCIVCGYEWVEKAGFDTMFWIQKYINNNIHF